MNTRVDINPIVAMLFAFFAQTSGVAYAEEWEEYGMICESRGGVTFYHSGDAKEFPFGGSTLRRDEGAKRTVEVVNHLIKDGWQPLGGRDMNGCQAMVKQ